MNDFAERNSSAVQRAGVVAAVVLVFAGMVPVLAATPAPDKIDLAFKQRNLGLGYTTPEGTYQRFGLSARSIGA